MFRINTQKELLSAFRTTDQKYVELPVGTTLPLTVLDYHSWQDPHGERVFLLFKAPGDTHVTGIVFRKDHTAGAGLGPRMCDWCLHSGSSESVGLLTASVNSKRRIGVFLCLDLKCGEHVEDDANRRGKSARDAVKELLLRVRRFAQEGLGIKQTNRNASAAP